MAKIINKEQIAPNIHQFDVEAPMIAAKAQPGQFLIAIPDEFSERTPMTISDWDTEEGTVTFIFLEIGASTEIMSKMKEGDEFYSFTMPLGNSYDIEQFGTVGLVGGCYGIGAIYPLARALRNESNKVICYSEARSNFLLYWKEKLEEFSDNVKYATGDGSYGEKGHAYDLLQKDLSEGMKYDRIIVVGCTYLMYRISELTRKYNIKTIVSMNTVMIDGTGMCGACRLEVGNTTKFACVDGPHFDGHEVNWDIILSRRKAYLSEEIVSKERW